MIRCCCCCRSCCCCCYNCYCWCCCCCCVHFISPHSVPLYTSPLSSVCVRLSISQSLACHRYNIIDWLTGKCMLACLLLMGTNERTNEATYKDRDIRRVCVCVYNFVCPRAHIDTGAGAVLRSRTHRYNIFYMAHCMWNECELTHSSGCWLYFFFFPFSRSLLYSFFLLRFLFFPFIFMSMVVLCACAHSAFARFIENKWTNERTPAYEC